MSKGDHARLVALGAPWLKRQGFSVVATETRALDCRKIPDVVGFRATCSAIIEAKASRSDFPADDGKPERREKGTGLGTHRFSLANPGVIAPHDLPPGRGLLEPAGRGVRMIAGPTGNHWPGPGTADPKWWVFQHVSSPERERAILFSIARRHAGRR